MSARIIKLLSLIVVVAAIVSYIFYLNPQAVAVTWAKGSTFEKPLAVVLIAVFCTGAVFSSFFWAILGLQYKFRDWQFQKEQKTFRREREQLLEARGLLAAGNYQTARRLLERLIRDNPDDVLARISLAESFRREGKLRQALAVLDQTRRESKTPEVLLLAAELNTDLGNPTAAYDNLALLLTQDSGSSLVLDRLVVASRQADRLEDALELQRKLIRHPGDVSLETHLARQRRLAELEVAFAKKRHEKNLPEYRSALEDILRRHRDFPQALFELGIICREQVHLDDATRFFSRAFAADPNPKTLEAVARTWLAVDDPGKAISVTRKLVHGKISPTEAAIAARVFFVALLLALDNIEDAIAERRLLEGAFGAETRTRPDVVILDTLILRKSREADEAFDMLFHTLIHQEQFPHFGLFRPLDAGHVSQPLPWEKRARRELLATEQPPPRLLGT